MRVKLGCSHGLRVFENRVLRSIFVPKRDEVTGEWKDYVMRISDLHSSPNIIWVIKQRKMRWGRHLARMGERRGAYRWGNLRQGDHLEDP